MQVKTPLSLLSPFTIRAVLIGLLATTVAASGTWIALELSNDSLGPIHELRSSAVEHAFVTTPAGDGPVAPSKPDAPAPSRPGWYSQSPNRGLVSEAASPQMQPVGNRAVHPSHMPSLGKSDLRKDNDQFTPLISGPPARIARGPTVLEVTPGVKLPAVLMETDELLSAPTAAIKDQIAEDFARELSDAADPENSEDPDKPEVAPDAYDPAVRRADERYRMFFGDSAYNRMTMQAAKRAVQENRQ